MNEMVTMIHPDLGRRAGPVTRRAFEHVWAPKGWVVADDNHEEAAEPLNEEGVADGPILA